MLTRFVLPARSVARGGLRLFCALALPLVIAVVAPIVQNASAKAPQLATTVLNAEALLVPDYDAAPVAVIPQGTEVELTGGAAPGFPGFPGFLGVYYDGETDWVPPQYLTRGVRPGTDTGITVADTPLLDAPMRDTSVLEIVPEGQAVILTGARVDGYDAASHEGTGGWINERVLSR